VSFEKWIPKADPDGEAGEPLCYRKPDGSLAAIDLLSKLLTYIPESRISARQGLDHPWLLTFADPEEESLSPKPRPFTRWQEIESLETIDEFRDAIWIEVQVCNVSCRLPE
jgi:serine/threonine protein kinase